MQGSAQKQGQRQFKAGSALEEYADSKLSLDESNDAVHATCMHKILTTRSTCHSSQLSHGHCNVSGRAC